MSHNHSCKERKCQDQGHIPFERNNYFCGKLMVDRDFWTDQLYHAWKLRKHTTHLHGWGAVCGLEVQPHPLCPNLRVVITPGFAVDCWGREIFISQEYEMPLESYQSAGSVNKPQKLYLTLSYLECETELVPVFLDECGCNESKEPNRIREVFDVELLTEDEFAKDELDGYRYDQISSTAPVKLTKTGKLGDYDGKITIKTLYGIFKKDISIYTNSNELQEFMTDIDGAGLKVETKLDQNSGIFTITSSEVDNVILLMEENATNSLFTALRLPSFKKDKGNKILEPCPDCCVPQKIILAEITDYDQITADHLDPIKSEYKTAAYKLDNLTYRKVLPRVDTLHRLLIYNTFNK